MGTFANLFYKYESKIPTDEKEEFKSCIEKLFQAGGMMEVKLVQICDKKVSVLKKASMHSYGMDFYYNYFEDACWENAGFNTERNSVWSNKIGWSEFHRVIVAAYTLQSLYLNGPAIAMVNGEFVSAQFYIGWINYLFQEKFPLKNHNPWELFEAMHDQLEDDLNEYEWEDFIRDVYDLIEYYEIRAVLIGSDALDEEIDKLTGNKENDNLNFFDCIKKLKIAVKNYHETSERSETEQFSLIMEMLYLYYEQESGALDGSKKYEEKELEVIRFFVALADAPAYVIKVISETYEKDFWELWEMIKDVAKKRYYLYKKEEPKAIEPVSTMDFFDITGDDMILFWGDDKSVRFSPELEEWFDDLKNQFDEILKEEFMPSHPLRWILELMEYADENYYRVYTFADFFDETIDSLNDNRYLALWKIYDILLHDQKMEEDGSVIFVPDGPEHEHEGLHYFGTPPRRRLKTSWNMIGREEKNNRARVTLRRYMALLENRKLRKEVFGF